MAAVSAAAFSARGGPGQGDDPQDAHLAIDGLRGTAWHTDWYTTSRFGNLYAGTGLIVDMGHPVTITGVRLTLGLAAGADVAIRVGDRPALAGHAPGRPFGRPRRSDQADAGPSRDRPLSAGVVYQAAARPRRNLQS